MILRQALEIVRKLPPGTIRQTEATPKATNPPVSQSGNLRDQALSRSRATGKPAASLPFLCLQGIPASVLDEEHGGAASMLPISRTEMVT
jgi:hypothetical protein